MNITGRRTPFHTPATGDVVFDKALNGDYRWNGSAWVSAAGAIVGTARSFTAAGLTPTRNGSTAYAYSATTAPTTSNKHSLDTTSLSYTAKKAGAILKIRIEFDIGAWATELGSSGQANGIPAVLGLLRDSVTTAIDWCLIDQRIDTGASIAKNPYSYRVTSEFYFTVPDASAHTYKFAIFDAWDGNPYGQRLYPSSIARRLISIEELA